MLGLDPEEYKRKLDEAHDEAGMVACENNPDAWFPDYTINTNSGHERDLALKLCDICEIRIPCLFYALAAETEYGIWGGKTPSQRRALAKQIARSKKETAESLQRRALIS